MKILGKQKNLLQSTFSTTFSKSTKRLRDFNQKESYSGRWAVLASLIFIFLILILGRLIDLQLIEGSYFKSLSEGNRIRRIPIKAPRGEILDRTGVVLVHNVPVYKLATFTSSGVVEKTEIISREEALRIQTSDSEDASRLLIDTGREYSLGEVTAHVLGYVNETTPDEIGKMPNCGMVESIEYGVYSTNFQLGDLTGRSGVEEYYDCVLRGVNGEELIEVDAKGRLVRRLGRKEPIPGINITLSIDIELQKYAYEALFDAPDEKGIGPRREKGQVVKGGIVAQNPQTGEILALVSLPSYNPDEFDKSYQEFANDPNLPFFDRVIGGAYHPGSTFKMVTSIASLQEGVIDSNFKYTDVGFVEAGGTRFRNWYFVRYGKGEGEMNLPRAITRSTDTFFYITGEKVGIDKLASWAQTLGVGRKTGIDLPGEVEGLMPTPEWKQKTLGERWFLGNTYNTSIGQGDVAATPLQILHMTGNIAREGKECRPRVLKQNPNAKIQMTNECKDLGIRQENINLVKEGMIGACSPGGTAGQFFNFEPKVACKTGTAEVGTGTTHAWFTAFAPTGYPEIVVTAVIEEGGEGSTVAAPVVKKVIEKYFKK